MTVRSHRRTEAMQEVLQRFVFMDCCLGAHPRVCATVWRLGDDILKCVATTGFRRTDVIGNTVDIGPSLASGLTGYIVQGGKATEWHFLSNKGLFGDPTLAETHALRSLLSVPITSPNEKYGVLNLYFKDAHALDEKRHMGRAQLLAALLAYAVTQGTRRPTALSASIGQALKRARNELGLTQQQVADRLAGSRIAVSRWEAGAQPPSIGQLLRWCEALGLVSDDQPTIVTCVDVSADLLRLLRDNPDQLASLSPEQFEHFIANRLDRMGFDVKLTGPSSLRDGGIDLIAVPKVRGVGAFLLAGQVKHHRSGRRTGRPAVDRLLSWKDSPFRIGLLVTNTGFSRDALWAASEERARHFLRLREFEDLKRWLRDNFWSEDDWREIPDTLNLAPGLTVEIPRSRIHNSLEIWPMRRLSGTNDADAV